MKHKFKLILTAAAISMAGCSSSVKLNDPVPIKDTKLATNFTDEGVKIFYTFTGRLERIEVYGHADAWKGNVETLAEADALAKLVKFVYGNDVSTNRKVSIIGKAIENAEDTTNTDTITSDSKELESELKNKPNNSNSTNAKRTAKVVNETITDTVTSMKSQGKLVGVRKAKDYQKDNGKTYVAVYVWSEKDQAISENIRTRMMGKE
jgi:hypothetical protein